MLQYLFYPNPGNASYTSPKALVLTIICIALIAGSFAVKKWRSKLTNSVTKKLSRSWGTASFWFGLIGLFMVISRVEGISYVSMRFFWILWFACLIAYIVVQYKLFKARHYEVVHTVAKDDPRSKYLPKKK